jgi:hypothetical protein
VVTKRELEKKGKPITVTALLSTEALSLAQPRLEGKRVGGAATVMNGCEDNESDR